MWHCEIPTYHLPQTVTASCTIPWAPEDLEVFCTLFCLANKCVMSESSHTKQTIRMLTVVLLFISIAFGLRQLPQAHGSGIEGVRGKILRTEWPELLHKDLSGIFENFLHKIGHEHPGFSIFIQKPHAKDQKPSGHEEDTDVWLYLTESGVVYEIPRHGRWHPNRISPGWPELLGVHYKDAIKIIMADMPGVLVDYGPLQRPKPKGRRINRVVLYVNDDEKIARIPTVG